MRTISVVPWMLLVLLVCGVGACGPKWPPFAPRVMEGIDGVESAQAWRLEPAERGGYERVGGPVVLDEEDVRRVRGLLMARSTYGGHRVKCVFMPVVEIALRGARDGDEVGDEVRVRLCFACDEMNVVVAEGEPEWARFVPGSRGLRALVESWFPGIES